MGSPFFIATGETTAYNTTTTPKTSTGISVQLGDRLLATIICETGSLTSAGIATASGSTTAWTLVVEPTVVGDSGKTYHKVMTAVVTATGTVTVNFTTTGWLTAVRWLCQGLAGVGWNWRGQ